MNIFASIIDQRLESVIESIRQQATEELGISEADRLKSLAFVYLCVKTILDLDNAIAPNYSLYKARSRIKAPKQLSNRN